MHQASPDQLRRRLLSGMVDIHDVTGCVMLDTSAEPGSGYFCSILLTLLTGPEPTRMPSKSRVSRAEVAFSGVSNRLNNLSQGASQTFGEPST